MSAGRSRSVGAGGCDRRRAGTGIIEGVVIQACDAREEVAQIEQAERAGVGAAVIGDHDAVVASITGAALAEVATGWGSCRSGWSIRWRRVRRYGPSANLVENSNL